MWIWKFFKKVLTFCCYSIIFVVATERGEVQNVTKNR
nr:MAG TPA: hypothetical protein [Caudoviricetes sp.]DAU04240.1 MAG TPA: hypothetical protein [Caudoviricetes sp.]